MAVTITCQSSAGPHFKPLGEYLHKIRWVTTGTDGFIIQHIRRSEVYQDADLHDCPYRSELTEYWEAWRVQYGNVYPNSSAHGGWNDAFTVGLFIPPGYKKRARSRGHWRIRGTVFWTPLARFDLGNWTKLVTKKGEGTHGAGRLYHRETEPNEFVLGRPRLQRNEAGEWDSLRVPPIDHRRRRAFGKVRVVDP